MNNKTNLKKYHITSQTVDKMQQIILLYEGMVRMLKKAKYAASNNQIEEKFNILDKISQIINGLNSSLDHIQGGEIASILRQFYDFIYVQILLLNQNNNLEMYDVLEKYILEMLNSWKDVEKTRTLGFKSDLTNFST